MDISHIKLRPLNSNSSGIYVILSSVNKYKIYIGSAVCLSRRKNEHLCSLRKGNHNNRHIQRHYNKYGESDISFFIIEFCSIENLLIREQYWMDKLLPWFNMSKIAGGLKGIKRSKESILKMSIFQKSRIRTPLSEETKKKISLANKGKKRKPFTEEHKQKISLSNKGKIGSWNGRFHSEETRLKMSNSAKRIWLNRNKTS